MDIQADIRDLFILAHRIAAAAWSQDTGVTPEEDFLDTDITVTIQGIQDTAVTADTGVIITE